MSVKRSLSRTSVDLVSTDDASGRERSIGQSPYDSKGVAPCGGLCSLPHMHLITHLLVSHTARKNAYLSRSIDYIRHRYTLAVTTCGGPLHSIISLTHIHG